MHTCIYIYVCMYVKSLECEAGWKGWRGLNVTNFPPLNVPNSLPTLICDAFKTF